jgi:hypothetical protein
MQRTDRRFSVRVPVLSVKMIVVAPSVSTAARRSTSAFCRAMRHIPRASAMVATIGSPSGMAATARAIDASIIRNVSPPDRTPNNPIAAHIASVTQIRCPARRSSCFSSGERSGFASSTSAEIRPSWVSIPVLTTTAVPPPRVMAEPLKTIDLISAIGVSCWSRERGVLLVGLRGLFNRDRFAGQGGFVCCQVWRLDQPEICGDNVSALEDDDVAGHQILRRQNHHPPVAPDPGRDRAELAQRFHRPHRANFGHEANRRIHHQHRADCQSLDDLAIGKRHRGRDRQQHNHRAGELVGQYMRRHGLAAARQQIWAMGLQPGDGVSLRQPGADAHAERRKDILRPPRMCGTCQVWGGVHSGHTPICAIPGPYRARLPRIPLLHGSLHQSAVSRLALRQ